MDGLVDSQRSQESAAVISNDVQTLSNSSNESIPSANVKRDVDTFENENEMSGNEEHRKRRKTACNINPYTEPTSPKSDVVLTCYDFNWKVKST